MPNLLHKMFRSKRSSRKREIPHRSNDQLQPVNSDTPDFKEEEVTGGSDGDDENGAVIFGDQIWLRAMQSCEIRDNKRWPDFKKSFNALGADPTIEDVMRGFTEVSSMEPTKAREILAKVVQFTSHVKDIGNSVVGLDPTKHAAAVWGLLQVLVTAAVKAKDTYSLVRDIDTLTTFKDRCSMYAELYLPCAYLSETVKSRMSESLETMFIKLMKYLIVAWDYLQSGKLNSAFKSLMPGNEVQDAFDALTKAEQALLIDVTAANSHATISILKISSQVVQQLEKLSQPLQHSLEQINALYLKMFADERMEVFRWLSNIPQAERFNEICDSHMPGTGGWFQTHPKFEEWSCSDYSCSLWLQGRMGTGKSTVTATAVSELLRRDSKSGKERLAYFFCDSRSATSQSWISSPTVIFRNLLRQLSEKADPANLSAIGRKYAQLAPKGLTLSLQETTELLAQLISPSEETVLVLDSIDACSVEVRSDILETLSHLQHRAIGLVKILISSRPEVDIVKNIAQLDDFAAIEMDSYHDIDFYVKDRVASYFRKGILPEELMVYQSELIGNLTSKANGMCVSRSFRVVQSLMTSLTSRFQWVVCALKSLTKTGLPQDILHRVQQMPAELSGLYNQAWQQLQVDDEGVYRTVYQVFTLLMFHRIEISASAVAEAVLEEGTRRRLKDPRAAILKMCAYFVNLDEFADTFRFNHSSVTEFFESHSDFVRERCHCEMTKMCLASIELFFSMPFVGHFNPRWRTGQFICYALCQWPWHIAHIMPTKERLQEANDVKKLKEKLRRLSRSAMVDSRTREWFLSGVDLAEKEPNIDEDDSTSDKRDESLDVELGSFATVSSFKLRSPDQMGKATSAIQQALVLVRRRVDQTGTSQSHQISKANLFQARRSSVSSFQPGKRVSRARHRSSSVASSRNSSLNSLLSVSSKASIRSDNAVSPARAGVIAAEGDVKEKPFENWTMEDGFAMATSIPANPLFAATTWGVPQLIELMFAPESELWNQTSILRIPPMLNYLQSWTYTDPNARILDLCPEEAINSPSHSGQTPLHYACERGDIVMVDLLLNKKANCNVCTLSGETPLHFAVQRCDVDMVQKLIQYGATIDRRHPKQQSLLWLAIASVFLDGGSDQRLGMVDIVTTLAGYDRDLVAGTTYGYSLLHVAGAYDDKRLAQLMVSLGADINASASNSHSWTPLHFAADSPMGLTVTTLLEAGASPNATDDRGQTPLHVAASREAVEILIQHGANPDVKDVDNQSPIETALFRGASAAVEALLLRGKKPFTNLGHGTLLTKFNLSERTVEALANAGIPSCVALGVKRRSPYQGAASRLGGFVLTSESSSEADCTGDQDNMRGESYSETDDDDEKSLRDYRIEVDDECASDTRIQDLALEILRGKMDVASSEVRRCRLGGAKLETGGSSTTRRARSLDCNVRGLSKRRRASDPAPGIRSSSTLRRASDSDIYSSSTRRRVTESRLKMNDSSTRQVAKDLSPDIEHKSDPSAALPRIDGRKDEAVQREDNNFRLLLQHFFTKAALVITSARMPPSGQVSSTNAKLDKWFQLIHPASEAIARETEDWRSSHFSQALPGSMTIEVYLHFAAFVNPNTLCIGSRGNLPRNFGVVQRSNPTPRSKFLLERWEISLTPNGEGHTPRKSENAQVYKSCITSFRALYTICKLLPTWKLLKSSSMHSNGSKDLTPQYLIRHKSSDDDDDEIPTSWTRNGQNVSMAAWILPPIMTSAGSLGIKLKYCDFAEFFVVP